MKIIRVMNEVKADYNEIIKMSDILLLDLDFLQNLLTGREAKLWLKTFCQDHEREDES